MLYWCFFSYKHVNRFLGEGHLPVPSQLEEVGEVVAYVLQDGKEAGVGEAVEHPHPEND